MTLNEVPTVAKNVAKAAGFLAVLGYEVVRDTLKGLYGP